MNRFDYDKWKKEKIKNRKLFEKIEDLCLSISSKGLCNDKEGINNLREMVKDLPEDLRPSDESVFYVKIFAEQLANILAQRSL